MYVGLWGWFWQEEVRAIRTGDAPVMRLIELIRKGWAYRRSAESDKMLATFREAAALASGTEHACWELFCRYWACTTLFYHVDDLQGALRETVELISQAHRPHFAQCPIRGRIYFLLSDIYYTIDPFGYEDKIREAYTHLTEQIGMDEDTHLRVKHRLADLAFLYENYDEAFDRVTSYMATAQDNHFRMRSAYMLLHRIAFARGDIPLALEHAKQVAFFAGDIDAHEDVGISILWEAACEQRLGNTVKARSLYKKAMHLFDAYDLPHWAYYYNACCDYLEMCGDPEQALHLREKETQAYIAYGSVWYVGRTHLQTARLLGRMGRNCDEVLEHAEALTKDMLKPAIYLSKVERIRKGDYYEFAWQGVTR